MDKKKLVKLLNTALEHEMSSMVRYLHHSFIVSGPQRGPLTEFFRAKVNDSAKHAVSLGDKITAMGGHPSVNVTEIYEPGDQTIKEILEEDLQMEKDHVKLYEDILSEVKDNVALRVYIENMVCEEQEHADELEMYIRGAK